ncbi:MAG: hypothetical protein HKN72_02330 [Gemmatimonadetes bacterium]|nr:hypothetical protein [Gemmatimonadota bacterium]
MTSDTLRPTEMASATLFLGGLLLAIAPGYVLPITELVLVTLAAGACVFALSSNVPPTGWISPFKWLSPFGGERRSERRRHGTDEIEGIRAKLGGRRQRLEAAPPLPPEVLRTLQPLIATAVSADGEAPHEAARHRLSERAWSILTAEPLPRPYWIATVRPNPWEVAAVVVDLLAELDRISTDTAARTTPPPPPAASPRHRRHP